MNGQVYAGPAARGASGAIFYNSSYRDFSFAYPIPASVLGEHDGDEIFDYINKTRFLAPSSLL